MTGLTGVRGATGRGAEDGTDLETTVARLAEQDLAHASDDEIIEALEGMVAHVEFPCLGAKSVMRREKVTYAVLDDMDSPDLPALLLERLAAFAHDIEGDDGFHSFVATFRGPLPADEAQFETSLFTLLQRLHDADDEPWAPGVDSDPTNPHFAFSAGGTAYFIVGLHPAASRVARRAPLPTLVFNPHAQFEQLREQGRYDGMRETIRRRDVDLQGFANPMVADHGESTEALQYSGRAHPAGWEPPLEIDEPRSPSPSSGRYFGPGGPIRQIGREHGVMEPTRLAPQTGTAFLLEAGRRLVVIDPTGEQVSDFFAVMAEDHDEWFSSGRTIDYANSTLVTTGTVLYSNRSRPMATVVEDTCGRHDVLLTPCSQQTFDLLYPELEGAYHPSCFENLATNMGRFGVDPDRIGATLNIFMNVWAERNGELHIDPPTSRAGDRLVLRAEADLVVGLTACSAEKSNNGVCKPIDYLVED